MERVHLVQQIPLHFQAENPLLQSLDVILKGYYLVSPWSVSQSRDDPRDEECDILEHRALVSDIGRHLGLLPVAVHQWGLVSNVVQHGGLLSDVVHKWFVGYVGLLR
jgi:hypothetical protein